MAREADRNDSSWAFLAPVDLREHNLPSQAALGFHRGSTQELLDRAADTIERLNRELAELRQTQESWKRDRERLESQLEEAKTRAELLVGEAMLDAHKAGQAIRAEAHAEAEKLRAKAEALLAPARQEAQRLVPEAREKAAELVANAQAEVERLSAQAEQYRLLSADVQRRSVDSLQRALEALGAKPSHSEAAAEDVAPFRRPDRHAAGD